MQRTNIYLEERQTAALDQVARRDGVTRAEVVRRLVDRGLEAELGRLEDDLEAIRASFGVLADHEEDQDEGLAPRDAASAREEHLRRVWGG